MITRSEYIRQLREQYPTLYPQSVSDQFVYQSGRRYNPNTDVEDWEQAGYVGGKKVEKPDVDISPDGWSALNAYGIDDDSWEWAKHAYANSLSGTLDAWKNGQLNYDMKDYEDLGISEKILSGVASFLMPLDVLTLMGGGLATRGVMAIGKKAFGKKLLDNLAIKGAINKAENIAVKKYNLGSGVLKGSVNRAIQEGNTLGIYEAAKAGLQADMAGEDVMSAIGHGYTHGAILGGVLGGVGGTLEGNFLRYRMLKEARVAGDVGAAAKGGFAKHYKIPELEKLMKYTGKFPQYAAEVGVLEASSLIDVARNGELKGANLLEDFIVNAGFVGLMKGKRKLTSKAYEPIAESLDAYKKAFAEKVRERENKEVNLKDKVTEGLEDKANELEGFEPASAKTIRDAIKDYKKIPDNESSIMDKIVTLGNLQKELIYSQERAKDDVNIKESKQMSERVIEQQTLGNKAYQALLMAKKDGKILGKSIPKVERILSDFENEGTGWKAKATVAESRLGEKQTTARKLESKLLEKDQLPKEIFEKKLEDEAWVDNYIKGTERAVDILSGKKAPLGKDVTLTKTDYTTGKKTLKNILEKKDVTTAGSDIVRDVFKGKFKSGKKYIDESVSEFNKVALQDWIKADTPKSATKNLAPFAAKLLNHLGKRGIDVDKLEVSDVLSYINTRRIELDGKTLGPTELSGISKFTKHLASRGKFNKIIDYTNVESLFQATNKKLKSGTEPPVAGVRREGIKIGKELSTKGVKDKGFEIAAELMASFGVRDIEIPHLTAKFLKRTKKNKPYIDMIEREFIAEEIGGREVASIGMAKVNTIRVPLMITEKLANKMNDYFNAGGKLQKKHYSTIGKLITKSDNKQRKQLDFRPQIQSTVLEKAPELMEQANWMLRHDRSRVSPQYSKLTPERAIPLQEAFHKRIGTPGFEAPVKKVAKPKKKPKAPTPPRPEVETAVSEIKQTIKYHEKVKGKKNFLQKFFSSIGEQEQTIAKKNVIIDALHGEFYKKQPALESIKEFIGVHKDWIERIKQNPEKVKKQFGDEAGDIAWHKKYIDIYKKTEKLIKEAKETELPYGLTRKKTFQIVKQGQKTLGIERAQIGKEAYERNLFKDTQEALAEGVKSLSKLSTDDVVDYFNIINSKDYKASENNWRARETTAKKMAEQRGFTKKDLEELLKAIDEDTGGKWENIKTKGVIDEVISFLSTHEVTKFEPSATEKMINFTQKSFLKFPGVTRRIVTPIWSLLKNPKIGGKLGSEIADSFLNWDVTNARHRGRASVVMGKIRNLLGDDARMLQFFDKQKVKAWKKDMTPEEIAFEKRMNTKGTKENEALNEWNTYRKEIWNKTFEYTKKWTNEAIAEKFAEKMSEKFVDDYFTRRLSDDALYAITTLKDQPFAGKLFKSKLDEYARSQTKDMAEKIKNMVRKEGESKLRFESRKKDAEQRKKDKMEKIKKADDTIDNIKSDIYTYLNMPHHTVYNHFFMERGVLLPRKLEIIDAKGKLKTINTYDESFRGTAEYYGFSMAKYLATLRHFPEVTELGKEFKLGNWKKNMFDVLNSPKERGKIGVNSDWADYLSMTLQAHLDMKTSAKERHNAKLNRWVGALSSTGAAAGLSTPFVHGLKNVALGFENSVRHFGMMNTLDGMRRYFDISERQRMKESGVADYFSGQVLRTQKNVFEEMGLTEKIPGGKVLTMDWMFKNWNLMTRSEEFARISSAFAGGLYFHQMLDAYKGVKNSFWLGEGTKGNAERAFRDQFKLSDKEIKWIKDTKHQDFAKKENAVKMASLMQKVEHYSHVSSQGGTSTILLPLWMSQGVAKPLTLFARIATSVTHDLWVNGVRPLQKHGNVMPLIRHAAASTFSGAGLYYFYKYIAGQEQMYEKSDEKWKTVMQMLWRSEFLGLWTELFNPHNSPIYGGGSRIGFGINDPSFVTDFFEPYMIRSGRAVVEGITKVMTDPANTKAWSQAGKYVLKNTVSFYGQAEKQWDRVFYPEKHEWKGFRTAARSFKKEMGYEIPAIHMETARSVYYKDLKDTFWLGDEKQFAKSYYDALSYIDADMTEHGFTNPAYRRKKAMQRIESSLKTLNPVNFSTESKGRVMSKKREFLNYLKRYDIKEYRRAIKAEREFNYNLRKLLASVHKSKYKLRYSPYYDRY